MQDPANAKQAAEKAAERWKTGSKSDELKAQIIATFRLQKEFAAQSQNPLSTAGQRRMQVRKVWTDAFQNDPTFHDFSKDDLQDY